MATCRHFVATFPHCVATFANTFFNCSLKLFRERWNTDFCTENHFYTYFFIFFTNKFCCIIWCWNSMISINHIKMGAKHVLLLFIIKIPLVFVSMVMNMNKNISKYNNIDRHTMPNGSQQSTKRVWQNLASFYFRLGQVGTKWGQSVHTKIKTS